VYLEIPERTKEQSKGQNYSSENSSKCFSPKEKRADKKNVT